MESLLRVARRHFKGVSWQHPVVSRVLLSLDPVDYLVRLPRGLAYLPKYSIRVRSNGVTGQFGGGRFARFGALIASYLQRYAGVTPSSRVLEIGCGCGRRRGERGRRSRRHQCRALPDHGGGAGSLLGMGTTVVGLLLAAERVIWFNVGDSRLYRYRDGSLAARSASTTCRPGDAPACSRSRSAARLRSLRSRRISGRSVDRPVALAPVQRRAHRHALGAKRSRAACRPTTRRPRAQLIEGAIAAGGHDNISIVIVSVGAGGETPIAATGANA